MGIPVSQLPIATEAASDDYIVMLDTSEEELKRTTVNHASSDTAFGLGTASDYGHTKIVDNLSKSTFANGEALAAHQGNVLANLIAFTETSPSAAAHEIDDYLIFDNTFWKVTSAISAGDNLVEGTNIEKTTVSEEVKTVSVPPVMTGATSSDAGTSGLTPIPSAGSEDKVLQGNGTWGHKLQIDVVEQNGVYGYINGSNVFVPFKSQADIDAAVAAARVGTATAADVLAGKTFTNANQSGVTGSMVDHAAATNAVSVGTNGTNTYHRIPTGAYLKLQGTGYPEIVTPLTEYGNASASDVVSGKTFTSSAGLKASGNLPNYSGSGNMIRGIFGSGNSACPAIRTATVTPKTQINGSNAPNAEYLEIAMPKGVWNWSWGNSSCCIPTQTKTVTASRSDQTITPDGWSNGSVPYALKSVTVNKYPDASGTYTYASGSTGGTVDMGTTNNYRYVNASNVYNKGKSDGHADARDNFVIETKFHWNNSHQIEITTGWRLASESNIHDSIATITNYNDGQYGMYKKYHLRYNSPYLYV